MKVQDSGSERIVFGDHVGWVQRAKRGVRLVTSSGEIKLTEDTEVRHAMPKKRAERLLRELATPGSGTTADELTLREIANVLRMSSRAIHRIIERADGSGDRTEAPEELKDHDYMGTFDVRDGLVLASPDHIAEAAPLALTIPALPGHWHVYIRHDPEFLDVSLAVFAVHEGHLGRAVEDGVELGTFDVTGTSVVLVDGRARKHADKLAADREWHEGIFDEVGCYAAAAAKSGTYPVRVVRDGDRAVVVRASLAGPDQAYFHAPTGPKAPPTKKYTAAVEKRMAAAKGEAQEYSPKLLFAVGDLVNHPKFGEGVVSDVLPDNKVQIDFRDSSRTLVHGR